MTNLQYLERFFKKHNLNGKIHVLYTNGQEDDDYMSDVIFENGDKMNIHDIIFAIESDFDLDVIEQWQKYRTDSGTDITLMDWIGMDNHYIPSGIDHTSMDEYKKEIESMFGKLNKTIDDVLNIENEKGED